MKEVIYQRVLAGMLVSVLALLCLSGPAAHAAQAVALVAPTVSELEDSYQLHSLHRNQIAERLKELWHEEGLLKAQFEVSGRSDDLLDLNVLARKLLQVRVEIDTLRSELSEENRVIQTIGQRIPD